MMKNLMILNDNTSANMVELSFRGNHDNSWNASKASERFFQSAVSLKAGEVLEWQIAVDPSDGIHCTAFSVGQTEVTEEDYKWMFETCAEVKEGSAAGIETLCEGDRALYCLSSDERKKIVAPSYKNYDQISENFKDMFEMLAETGAVIRFFVGAFENTNKHGGVIISLPGKMSLRMRSAISLAIPYITVSELNLQKDGSEMIPDGDFIAVMSKFIVEMLHRGTAVIAVEDHFGKAENKDECLYDLSDEDTVSGFTPIDELDLSIRSFNCLKRAGINSIEQLRTMGEEDLLQIRNLKHPHVEEILAKLAEVKVPEKKGSTVSTDYVDMLDRLVGLTAVKEQVKKLAAFAKMKQDLVRNGQNDLSIALNMAFVGNPGTAKTTVARILAGIYNEIGILPDKEIIEVGRADLIAKYEGQTAEKVKSVFERAKGKILFIDEAYSLVEGVDGAYGDEAISTIVQEMENNRDNTVVIFAGYPGKMESLFAKNAGLRSRVPFFIRFEDYSAGEMVQIAEAEAEKHGFTISPDGKNKVAEICETVAGNAEAGNGRFCRNLVEKAMLDYAMRVYGEKGKAGENTLSLRDEDFSISEIKKTEKKMALIGFRP